MSEKTPLLSRPIPTAEAPRRCRSSIVCVLRAIGAVTALGLVCYSIVDGKHRLLIQADALLTE